MTQQTISAAVIGLGPAGLATALALAHHGVPITLVGPTPTPAEVARDTRTTALFGGSVELLRNIGAWRLLAPCAAALTGLRLVDDTGGVLRAPETLFRAAEIGRTEFGFNVENAALVGALLTAVEKTSGISRVDEAITRLDTVEDRVTLHLTSGATLATRLAVGADGRRSLCRQASGVREDSWTYPQSALATRFRHSRPHGGISTEIHRRNGPFTTVPLAGNESSLVWVDTPAEIERLGALPDEALVREIETRLGGLLGSVGPLGPRAKFPLSGLTAKPVAQQRIALVGEAAHVLPPIGAQGLNLGFRDAAWLAEILGAAHARGEDVGAPAVLAGYASSRANDVATRALAVDLLNRSLFTGLLPADLARGAGLALVNAIPPLRRLVMREGIEPSGQRPRLLEPAG